MSAVVFLSAVIDRRYNFLRDDCIRAEDEGIRPEPDSEFRQLNTAPAKVAFMQLKDDAVCAELASIFAKNKGNFEKEASVYAKLVWYFAKLESVYT